MATPDFGAGKSVLIIAIVVGCFAVLWPKVFYPMMQVSFQMTKPSLVADDSGKHMLAKNPVPRKVCCDLIYENDLNLKFFAELCESVLRREARVDDAMRQYRREGATPPEGMLDLCRKKIRELCGIDVKEALEDIRRANYFASLASKRKPLKSLDQNATLNETTNGTSNYTISLIERLNLTQCLEEKFNLSRSQTTRRAWKPPKLPSHIHQERPAGLQPGYVHHAMKERGQALPPAPSKSTERPTPHRPGPIGGIPMRPPLGKVSVPTKQTGPMGFVMPIYTVGIIVFFAYTVMKLMCKQRSDDVPADRTPKVMDFHMDADFRRYGLNEEHSRNGAPVTYKDYLKKREQEEASKTTRLLDDDGRRVVFTAIEGIIAEMDEFRTKLIEEKNLEANSIDDESRAQKSNEESQIPTIETEEILDTEKPTEETSTPETEGGIEEIIEEKQTESTEATTATEVTQDVLKKEEIPRGKSEEGKITVMGMETQASIEDRETVEALIRQKSSERDIGAAPEERSPEFPGHVTPEIEVLKPPEIGTVDITEVPNIVLEASVTPHTRLLVAESQCVLSQKPDENEWDEEDGQPIIVTGKMTISLLAAQGDGQHRPISPKLVTDATPAAGPKISKNGIAADERQRIEHLASALVEDILQRQVVHRLPPAVASEVESVEVLGRAAGNTIALAHLSPPSSPVPRRRDLATPPSPLTLLPRPSPSRVPQPPVLQRNDSLGSHGSRESTPSVEYDYVTAISQGGEVDPAPNRGSSPTGSDAGDDVSGFDYHREEERPAGNMTTTL